MPEAQGPPHGRASRRPRGLGRNRFSLQPCRNPRVPPSETKRTSRHAREKPPYSPIATGSTGPPYGPASRRPRGLGRNRFSLQPCRKHRVPPLEARRTSRHAREKPPYRPIAAGSTGPPMDGLAEGRGVWEGTVFPFSRAGIQGYPLRRPGERLGTLGRNRPTVPSRPEARAPPWTG